jgi:two-component system, LytTR family, response regulator
METITIPTNKGLRVCKTDNIIRIQGMSNYCKIYFAGNSYPLTIAKVLHWFEEHLPAGVFWRTHKTHLVNTRYIKQLPDSQKHYLILNNGENSGS